MQIRMAFIVALLAAASLNSVKQPGSRVLVYIADPARQEIRFYWKNDSGVILGDFQRLKAFLAQKEKRLVFAMNGGMFKPDYAPVGLYVEAGKLLSPLDTGSGSGNFYLKPNGVFYITTANQAGICQTSAFRNLRNIKYATQSGPMLLMNGEVHPAFNKGSANLNIRNGVGLLPGNKLLFAMSTEPIGFYDFAEFFKERGCLDALYLDGFVSRTFLPEKGYGQTEGKMGVMIGIEQ